MDKLVCIITGPERNGTTYFKNLLDSHPDIFSGFETGLLLDDDFKKSLPFKDWIYNGNYQWGISKDINLFDKNLTISDKYSFLYHNKGSCQGYNQKLIRESKYLVDKTPAYFKKLPEIYKRLNNKDIPIIISIKYYEELYNSTVVKRGSSIDKFMENTAAYIDVMIWLKENKKQLKSIYLFSYKDIIKSKFIDKLKQIIGGRINVNYELSHDKYLEKIQKSDTNRPYYNWKKTEIVKIPESLKEKESIYDNLINELKEKI